MNLKDDIDENIWRTNACLSEGVDVPDKNDYVIHPRKSQIDVSIGLGHRKTWLCQLLKWLSAELTESSATSCMADPIHRAHDGFDNH